MMDLPKVRFSSGSRSEPTKKPLENQNPGDGEFLGKRASPTFETRSLWIQLCDDKTGMTENSTTIQVIIQQADTCMNTPIS